MYAVFPLCLHSHLLNFERAKQLLSVFGGGGTWRGLHISGIPSLNLFTLEYEVLGD